MSDPQVLRSLQKKINEKQNDVNDYLSYLEPLSTRLTYLNIISGTLAALLNGELVRAFSQGTISSVSWLIPVGAAIFSITATIAAGVHKAQIESRLSQVQKFAINMEVLATLLDARQLTEEEASKRYQKHLEESPPIPHRRKYSFDVVKGTINQPQDGQLMKAKFDASGTVYNSAGDVYLWLAVEIDGWIWPKEGRIVVEGDGQWSQPVFEDGVLEEFGLSLWVVNAYADRKIQIWLEEGNRKRTFPKLRPLPGMRRLARVDGLRRG